MEFCVHEWVCRRVCVKRCVHEWVCRRVCVKKCVHEWVCVKRCTKRSVCAKGYVKKACVHKKSMHERMSRRECEHDGCVHK